MSVKTLMDAAKTGLQTHKPEIMIGIGLAAGVGAVVVAIRETPACLEAFDKAEAEAPTFTETNDKGEEVEIKVSLDWKTKLTIFGKSYWKAALLEVASIFFIVCGTKIGIDAYCALAALYGATKADLDDVMQVISEQPDNWKKKFHEKMAESHMNHSNPEDVPESKMSDADVPMPLPLFWDDQAQVYFRMSEADLRDCIAEFTHMISTDPFGATSMNDWMRLIGHDDVVDGDYHLMAPDDPTWDGALKYQQIGVKEAPTGEPARQMRFSREYRLDTRGLYSNV